MDIERLVNDVAELILIIDEALTELYDVMDRLEEEVEQLDFDKDG
jgi:hypothetical protein